MASSITFGGLATGLDTNSIIDKLVELQSKPIAALKKRQTGVQAQISLVSDIASKLASLESATKDLGSNGVLAAKVTSTNTAFAATPGVGAATGTHQLQVTELARAAKARSAAFAEGETVQGGTLSLTVQDKSYAVTIAPDSTLDAVAEQLRASGAPISVSVLRSDGGRYLSVGSIATGAPLTGPGVALAFDEDAAGPGTRPLGLAIPAGQEARNAQFTLDGLPFTRTSNTVADALPGVTLALKTKGGPAEDLVVEADPEATSARLQKFVDAYNAVMKLVKRETAPTADTDRARTLTGDSSIRSLQGRLQAIVSSTFRDEGGVRSLADLGVKTDTSDGTLSLDATALAGAVARDPGAVNSLFSAASTGVRDLVSTLTQTYTRAGDGDTPGVGLLTARSESLSRASRRMDDDLDRLNRRLDAFRENLVRQFTAMESAVSKLKSSGNFLTAQVNAGSSSKE